MFLGMQVGLWLSRSHHGWTHISGLLWEVMILSPDDRR